MFDDPQVEAEAMLATLPHPTLGSYRGFAQPWVYGRTPGPKPFAAPTLGQHSDEVRRAVGGGD
jgi:formyl-CoA transferase